MTTKYGSAEYWNTRYTQDTADFDWLEDYNTLRPLFDEMLPKESKILMVGCGNAKLSEQMYVCGYHNIHNMDISDVVIMQMTQLHSDKPGMTWEIMDSTNMTYESNSFDCVIDKSTLDSILCGDDGYLNAIKTVNETHRVLDQGGIHIYVSYGTPDQRLKYLNGKHLGFSTEFFELAKQGQREDFMSILIAGPISQIFHYVYVSVKLEGADEKFEQNWNLEEHAKINEDYNSKKVNIDAEMLTHDGFYAEKNSE